MRYCVIIGVFVVLIAVNRADDNGHPAWSILNSIDCGESAEDRIIGGKNASLGQFPWIARLGYVDKAGYDRDKIEWMCGGSLISAWHVLTAAHCVTDLEPGLKLKMVRFGEYDLRQDPDCQGRRCAPAVQDRRIAKIIPHENFNIPAFHNDIAILMLERPVQLNDYVNTICLPKEDSMGQVYPGERVTTAGWGKMNMTTAAHADILQFVQLPVVTGQMCNSMTGSKRTSSLICAGAEYNQDACSGDSGGPLMKVYDTDDGPQSYLIGVVSFGPSVCGIKKPGVYTSTRYFRKWILDHVL